MSGRAMMKNRGSSGSAALLRSYEAQQPERRDVILQHFTLIQRDDFDLPRVMMTKLRTFTGWYTHGVPNGGELRRQISGLDSPAAFLEAVETFFERTKAWIATKPERELAVA
jgi:tRNA-dihydrouridine synthase